MSEGMFDDPQADIEHVALVPEGDMGYAMMTSHDDNSMVMASSVDDIREGHGVMTYGDDVMGVSNHDA